MEDYYRRKARVRNACGSIAVTSLIQRGAGWAGGGSFESSHIDIEEDIS